jgi:hypothetical protein
MQSWLTTSAGQHSFDDAASNEKLSPRCQAKRRAEAEDQSVLAL